MKKFKKISLVLILLVVNIFLFSSCLLAREAQQSIVKRIPSRPDPEKGPTEVSVRFWILDIDSIDSALQNFMANLYLELKWKDSRLAHDKKDLKRYNNIDIWTPRVQIVNETGIVRKTLPEVVEVSGDGTVIYRQRYVGPFSQPLDLKDFPFDEQKFRIHIVSTGNKESEVKFVPDEELTALGQKYAGGIAKNLSLPDWTIKSYKSMQMPYVAFPGIRKSAGYAFEFVAARGANYYIIKVIIPLLLIVFMSWSVFWIDPSRYATQMTISITSMLTLIAYRFSVDSQIPKVSYMTRFDFFMLSSTILVFLSLVEVVIVAEIFSKHPSLSRKIDFLSRVFFPTLFFLVVIAILRIGVY